MMNDKLYHKGIPGMKWGVQNGPPYPLSSAEHDRVVNGESGNKKKRISTTRALETQGYKRASLKSARLDYHDQRITQQKYEYKKNRRDSERYAINSFRKKQSDKRAEIINSRINRERDKVDAIIQKYTDKGYKVYSRKVKRKADLSTVKSSVSFAYDFRANRYTPVLMTYRTITQDTIDNYGDLAVNNNGREYYVYKPPRKR